MEAKELILWIFLLSSLILNVMYLISIYKENYKKTFEDPLTKVKNRKFLDEIKKMVEYSDDEFDIIFCDIDFFKKINDNYGHDIGDKVLEIVGQKLLRNFKENKDYIVRYGGEEFIIFMLKEGDTNNEVILKRINELKDEIEKTTFTINENKINFTMSFGICFYDKDINFDEQIVKADEALYFSKNNGRNKITIYDRNHME